MEDRNDAPVNERPVSRQEVRRIPGKSDGYAIANSEVDPAMRHALLMQAANGALFGGDIRGSFSDLVDVTKDLMDGTADDLSAARRLLTAQALTLDQVFTMMMARSFNNLAEYPDAAERYARLAFKAQAQSRTAIEALGKLVRGGEQVVRHIHVDNRGGQAVIAETVQTGGSNAGSGGQSHAREIPVSALCSPDPFGCGVSIPGDAERAMQDARREGGGAEG